jgi:hypothetical protein
MTILENYRDNLLLYIHENLSNKTLSDFQVIQLLKEHKRITNKVFRHEGYTYQSVINENALKHEKVKILQDLVNKHFKKNTDNTKKAILIYLCQKFVLFTTPENLHYLKIDRDIYFKKLEAIKKRLKYEYTLKLKTKQFIQKYF